MDTYLLTLWLQVGFLGILDSMLIFQRVKHRIKPLDWMITVISLALLRVILEILMNPHRIPWQPLKSSHIVAYAASILVLYHYGEYLIGDNTRLRRAGIVYLLFGSIISMIFTASIMDLSAMKNPDNWPFRHSVTPFWEFPFDLFTIFIWSFMLYVYWKMFTFSDNKKSRYQSLGMVISMCLFLFVSIYEISEHFTGVEVSASYTTIPAFLLLIGIYAYNPRFAYSSPVELYRIVLLHEHGQTIVEEVFGEKYKDDKDSHILLGGVTTGLNSIFKEITKSSADLEMMKSSTSTLVFAKAPNIIAILEVSKSTHILRNALKEFTNEFAFTYKKDLGKFAGRTDIFNEYKEILYRYFPFLL